MRRSPVRVVLLSGVLLGGCGIKGPARSPLPPSPPPTAENPAPAEAGRGPFAPSAPPSASPADAGLP